MASQIENLSVLVTANAKQYQNTMRKLPKATDGLRDSIASAAIKTAAMEAALKDQATQAMQSHRAMMGAKSSADQMVRASDPRAIEQNAKALQKQANQLIRTSDRLGIATEKLGGLRHAAEKTGNSAKTMDGALATLNRRVKAAWSNGGKAGQSFETLGLSINKLARMSPEKRFIEISHAINRLEKNTEQASVATDLFGRKNAAILTTIKAGVPAINAYGAAAVRAGVAMNRASAEAARHAVQATALSSSVAMVNNKEKERQRILAGLKAKVDALTHSNDALTLARLKAAGASKAELAQATSMQKQLAEAEKGGRGFGGGLAIASGIVAYGLVSVAKAAISASAEAEEVAGKFDAVFKDQKDSARQFASSLSKSFARSQISIEKYMGTLQDTFVPMGFSRDVAAEYSKTLTKAAIDLAAFNNMTDDEAMERLTSAIVGNHEAVRKFGIVLTDSTLKDELYRMGIKKTAQTASATEKAQARLNIIMKGSADAHGTAVREADNLMGKYRSFAAQVEALAGAIGDKLNPAAKTSLDLMSSLIDMVNRTDETQAITKFAENEARRQARLVNQIKQAQASGDFGKTFAEMRNRELEQARRLRKQAEQERKNKEKADMILTGSNVSEIKKIVAKYTNEQIQESTGKLENLRKELAKVRAIVNAGKGSGITDQQKEDARNAEKDIIEAIRIKEEELAETRRKTAAEKMKQADDIADGLEKELAAIGKNESELLRMKLAATGASQAFIDYTVNLKESVDAARKNEQAMESLKSEAERLKESLKSPFEKMQEEIQKLKDMLAEGLIDKNEFNDLAQRAREAVTKNKSKEEREIDSIVKRMEDALETPFEKAKKLIEDAKRALDAGKRTKEQFDAYRQKIINDTANKQMVSKAGAQMISPYMDIAAFQGREISNLDQEQVDLLSKIGDSVQTVAENTNPAKTMTRAA